MGEFVHDPHIVSILQARAREEAENNNVHRNVHRLDVDNVEDRIAERHASTQNEIEHLTRVIVQRVADSGFQSRIAVKVARAAVTHLIPLASVMDALESLDRCNVRCRGAYLVSAFKRVFRDNAVSWIEEEW